MVFPGFVGPGYQNQAKVIDGERSINWYPEVIESGMGKGGAKFALQPTPGKKLFGTLTDSPCRGIVAGGDPVGGQRCFAAAGQSLFEVHADGTSTFLGIIANDGNPVQMFQNGLQLYIVSGGQAYIDTGVGAVAPILKSDGTTLFALQGEFMDGFFFALLPGSNTVLYSTLLDGATPWPTTNSFAKEGGYDRLMAISVTDELLWLFGDRTSEVWENTGGATNPFQRVQSIGFINAGIAARFSVAKLHDGLVFLGRDDRGQLVAYRTKGYEIIRISNHAVEAEWQGYATVNDAVGYTYQENGHTFYVLRFPTANKTWAYDVTDSQTAQVSLWHERLFWNVGSATYTQDIAGFHCFTFDQHLVQDPYNGKIYTQSQGIYDDNGVPIRRQRTSPHLIDELKWIYYHQLQIDMSVGITPSVAPIAMLEISRDGGYTFGNIINQSTGAVGQFSQRVLFRRLGRSRDTVFRLTISDPPAPVVVGAYLNLEEGLA